MTHLRRLGLPLGLVLGVLGLALVVAFGVLLPKANGDEASVDLPDKLPGGYYAFDRPSPMDANDDSGTGLDGRRDATDYVRGVYDDVYGEDEPVAFRVYTDADFKDFVVVTVFAGDGGAFGPPSGFADPKAQQLARATTELVRQDDAVCIANYDAVPKGQDASADPVAVTCQLPSEEHTVQVTTNGKSVDATVELAHQVADRI